MACSQQNRDITTLINKDLNNIDPNKLTQYEIEVDLDDENMLYTGKQWVDYVNRTGKVLGEIYFHLYPNAFKNFDQAPILFSKDKYSKSNYVGGYIDIEKILINNKPVHFSILEDDETTLYIKLEEPLLQGQSQRIYLEYKVKLPSSRDRFGYGHRTINFGNWYPIVCVYDENGWNIDPYYQVGDPFYSDLANYKVTIKTHKDMVVASSGNIVSSKLEADRKVYNIEGRMIRDFAWVASKEFKVEDRKIDGTLVKLYYLDRNYDMVNKSLQVGGDSLQIFNRIFGQYPYGVYSIVMTEFPSGMEYPGIVFIGEEYFRNSLTYILEQIIVHETAHQWWYGLVGNNQIREAWLDEGLTTFSEVIYNREKYGKKQGEDYFVQNIKLGYELGQSYLIGEENIVNKPLNEFNDWNDYSLLVYSKGAMFINAIEEEFGQEALYKILNNYYERYKYHNVTLDDFIKVCEEVTKRDLQGLVEEWLH